MIRVYLSGPITGLTEQEYTARFKRAEQFYEAAGYEVVNPVTIGQELQKTKPHPTYEEYMTADLAALRTCTHIAMLPGWSQSLGARRELKEAERLGLEVMQLKFII